MQTIQVNLNADHTFWMDCVKQTKQYTNFMVVFGMVARDVKNLQLLIMFNKCASFQFMRDIVKELNT